MTYTNLVLLECYASMLIEAVADNLDQEPIDYRQNPKANQDFEVELLAEAQG